MPSDYEKLTDRGELAVTAASLATWVWLLPCGVLKLQIPVPVSAVDADDIEELFSIVMRRIRREAALQSLDTSETEGERT